MTQARPDGRQPQRGVDHRESAAKQQDAADFLVRQGTEAPGIANVAIGACDAGQFAWRGGRRIAEREHHLVGAQRGAVVEPQVEAAPAAAPQLQDAGAMVNAMYAGRGARRFEAVPQVLAEYLPR
jgi:hypothetical protein